MSIMTVLLRATVLTLSLVWVASHDLADSCATIGCGVYNKANSCQCNSACTSHQDCCSDFKTACPDPSPSPNPRPHPRPRPRPAPSSCQSTSGPSAGVEQLHLALTDTPEKMVVSFVTSARYSETPSCAVDGVGIFNGTTKTYTAGGWKGLLHTVVLSGLTAASTYTYDCGNGKFSFRTAPVMGTLPVSFAAVADLGSDCDRPGCGNATIDALGAGAKAGAYSVLLHAGDLAYTKGDTCIWDSFMEELQPATARVPYMVAAGNHEHYYNFSAYRARFDMPGEAVRNENLWYSFDYGGVHVTAFSTEHDLALQTDWLRQDLRKANANRHLVPWIVVMAHKPLYCSTNDYYDCEVGCHKISGYVEAILKEGAVDLFLAGHLHNYERSWPVYNGTVTAKSYANPAATVHAVIGMAGDVEGLTDSWVKDTPDWRAVHGAQLGYALLKFENRQTMHFEYVLSETGKVADSFTITKPAVDDLRVAGIVV